MRRNDREITDRDEIFGIIDQALVCHIAMSDDNIPYIVAMNFGFDRNSLTLYFHSAPEGKKIDILSKNGRVCFQFDVGHILVAGAAPCEWGMNYRSVVGYGNAAMVTQAREKITGLNFIMEHYSGKNNFQYPDEELAATSVFKIEISELKGKKKG